MSNLVLPLKQEMEKKPEDYLLKHLTVKLAPVLVKVKPSSLIALLDCHQCHQKNHCELWKGQWSGIIKTLKVSFKELRDTPRGKQMLFYNPEELFATIVRPENLSYLEKFGYSWCQCLNDYLELLKRRFNSSPFPHEIGLFLGYPLKDVKGFIEKRSLPLINIGRWQVFGEPGESMQLMHLHKKAEDTLLKCIENQRTPLPFLERLSRHFQKAKGRVTAQAS